MENLFSKPVTAEGTVHEADIDVEAGVDVPDDDVESGNWASLDGRSAIFEDI